VKYLIKNGRLIDPANKIDEICDLLISGGRVDKIGKGLDEKADETIDAKGRIVAPGLVDLHVHLREPGREDKETVASGTRAAVRGGFTSVACMPNTEPAIDSAEMVKKLGEIIKKDALCNVSIIGAITEGRSGKKLTDISGMKKAGVAAVSDDGSTVEDASLMLKVLKDCKESSVLLIDHCEDARISAEGVVNNGFISTKMGLRGISREAEYSVVKRDLALVKKSGAKVHIAHVSCRESVELIREAKKDGLAVTAETAPHYFSLTEDCCTTYDTNTKMNPPLRAREDAEAIKSGLADGTIDAIATDHAPHTDSEKDVEFDYAPFGIIGLETALNLGVMELVDKKILSWPQLITRMSSAPAGILGLERGNLKKGSVADIVVIDPAAEYVYDKDSVESKSKNSPFIGWKLKGRATHVFVGGKLLMKDGSITG